MAQALKPFAKSLQEALLVMQISSRDALREALATTVL